MGSRAGAAAGMICCGFAIQPPPCNGRRTLNGNAAPDPGGKNVQPGDMFEQLPTPGPAEFRDIRTWHRWAADFRIVTEGHRAVLRAARHWIIALVAPPCEIWHQP
jgi:hypothetical protein